MSEGGALGGYLVIDLAGTVASATCGKLFADFGARVVNLEPPEGHLTRRLEPRKPGTPGAEASALHALLSPNKESVVVDANAVAAREAISPWLAAADVVLVDGDATGWPSIRGTTPGGSGAVVCTFSWYGTTGPLAGLPGSDASVRAMSGQVYVTGPVEGPPILPAGYQAQVLGGVTGFVAIMERLVGRLASGMSGPAAVDVSLLDASLCLMETGAAGAALRIGQPRRLGINRFAPTYPMGIFEAQKGWLGVSVLTPEQWHAFCDLLGLNELAHIPEYQVTLGRLADADAIAGAIAPIIRQRPAEQWFHEGQARRIPLALVPTLDELFESEQMRALGAFRTVSHPDMGDFEVPGAPFRLRGTPAYSDGRVARLGEHAAPAADARRESPRSAAQSPRAALRADDARPGFLRGLRVLDLSMGWAGPLAARHLADAGADVIKIESRANFDWWRGWEATAESLAAHAHEKAVAFNVMNRNKYGITLDLAHPRGREIFLALVAGADALVENYSAGVLPKLGLGWPVLHRHNPGLVMLSMPPFGAGGPWHHYRAYGSTVEQASGLPHLQGGPGDPPVMEHVAIGDPVAGVYGAAALLTALCHQQRTGEGQLVDLSQVEAVTTLGLHGIAHHALLGGAPPRTGNRHPEFAPQGVYRCAGEDEWLMLCVDSDAAWRSLVEIIGNGQLDDVGLASVEGRRDAHDEIDAAISHWSATREKRQAAGLLLGRGIIAAPVLTSTELLDEPQLAARDFWQPLERAYVGEFPHPKAPYCFDGGRLSIGWPAPTFGEHTREVLAGILGLDGTELDGLEDEGVIGTVPVVHR